jgi:hypothetical protein
MFRQERISDKETVKIPEQAAKRIRWAICLICLFVFFDFTLGIYHFTHGGGWVSGTIELFFACLITALACLVFKTRLRRESAAKHNNYRVALLCVISAIVITLLVLSLYHFTHQGLPSGIIELLLSGILVTGGCLTAVH